MLEQFLQRHTVWDTIVIFWVVSAAVNALPEPGPDAGGFYSWLYLFLTALVGHLTDAINRRRPTTAQPNGNRSK